MKKQKMKRRTGRFAVSLLIAVFLAGISMANARNIVFPKPMKYKLSIDPVIDEGKFWQDLF